MIAGRMYADSHRETPASSWGFCALGLNLAPVPPLHIPWPLDGSELIAERKKMAKTPHEHFMQAVEDELTKFVGKEIAFQ
jgi:hypothetical protein